MTQIERIEKMDDIFSRSVSAYNRLFEAFEQFRILLPEIDKLTKYYENGDWLRDYTDDELGQLPSDMRRGVLSQDGVYNLLSAIHELIDEIADIKGSIK